jgi:hypothetical protein
MNYENERSKIQAYLDGTLRAEEVSAFEARALEIPELMREIQARKDQLETLKSMIPEYKLDLESMKSLNQEIQDVTKDLFKSPDKVSSKVKFWWNELF